MKVTLVNYTQDARELLLFTKNTRLLSEGGSIDDIKAWSEEKKQKELDYMLGTIQSSWEFVNYVFYAENVSRAFTHQVVRTRTASFAQQSHRTVDMVGFDFVYPVNDIMEEVEIDLHLAKVGREYTRLKDKYSAQVARSILPTNVSTNIIIGASLRTLSEMAKVRLCTRTQGEYQDVFRQMRRDVLTVHPWAEPFIRVYCAATGVCCFPNYKECPIKPGIFNPDTGNTWDDDGSAGSKIDFYEGKPPYTKEEIQKRWENIRYEANPGS